MKLNKMFPSTYLKAADFDKGELYEFTIDKVTKEWIGKPGEEEEKPVLHFIEEGSKPMVLNRTNANTIAIVLGSDDTDNWHGQVISLYNGVATMAGKSMDAIRVDDRPSNKPKPKATNTNKPQQAQQRPVNSQRSATLQRTVSPTQQHSNQGYNEAPPDEISDEDIPFEMRDRR